MHYVTPASCDYYVAQAWYSARLGENTQPLPSPPSIIGTHTHAPVILHQRQNKQIMRWEMNAGVKDGSYLAASGESL